MRDLSDIMRDLAGSGATPEQMALAMELYAAGMALAPRPVDEAAERRRATDRERTANRRAECDEATWIVLRTAVFSRDEYRCTYCDEDRGPLHCDHIVPLSRGGRSEMSNLTTACARCNASKGNRTPEEWEGGDAG